MYKVKQTDKGKWYIERPDGTVVNESYWDEEWKANKYLDILKAMGYAKT